MIGVAKEHARRFLLLRHGLLGPKRYEGKSGALEYIRSVGSIQYDPVDVCGKNAEIILHSRVRGFTRAALDELLYRDRLLIDFFDKCLCIFPVEDWPLVTHGSKGGGYAAAFDNMGGEAARQIAPRIREYIKERGHISSKEVETNGVAWSWDWALSRAALESMWFRRELVIHHKKGAVKSYALAEDYIPAEFLRAASPFADEGERLRWLIKRRIGAVGMLWNRSSDAWIGLKGDQLTAGARLAFLKSMAEAGEIFEVRVDGIRDQFYIREPDRPILETAMSGEQFEGRAEFIAPLDCLFWDRKLIEAVFGFSYRWEIYTVREKRKFGAYTLPFLRGESFAGRADIERKNGALIVRNFWPEDGVVMTDGLREDFAECAERFAEFNGCGMVENYTLSRGWNPEPA